MKLNWAERLVVNNPLRVIEQRHHVRWMKRVMPLAPGGSILEIGCGRGAGAAMILEEFKPAVLHATDLDPAMLRRAQRYLSPAQRGAMQLYAADASSLPCRDASMDAVFGFGVLHHVPDWRSALAEIGRVVKPGGVYYLEELYPTLYQNFLTKHILLHPTHDRFGSSDLHEALGIAGFTLRDSREIKLVGILAVLVKSA